MKSQILFLVLAFLYQCYCLSDAWLSLPAIAAPDSPRDKVSETFIGSGKKCDTGETYQPGVHDIESYNFYFAFLNVGHTYDLKNTNSPIVRCSDPNYYPVFFNPHFNNTLRLARYKVKRADDGKIYPYAVIYNCYDTDRTGYVYAGPKKKEMIQLVGNWDKVLFKVEPENKLESIWSANTFPPNYEDQYGFGQFTVELNEITPDIKDKLPPTDTRFRPDQRLYEEGKADEASAEKERLEQSQREYLKERELKGIPWEPRWFELKDDPIISGVKTYQYKGGYFEQRGNITVERELW